MRIAAGSFNSGSSGRFRQPAPISEYPPASMAAEQREARTDEQPPETEEHASIDKQKPWRRLIRLFRYAGVYKARLGVAIGALVVGAGLGLVYPWYFGELLGDAFAEQDSASLNHTTLILLATFAAGSIFVFIRHYLMSWVGERVVADLRREVHGHLLTMTQRYFHKNRTGELLSRQSDDATRLQGVIGQDLSMALRNILTLFGGIAMLMVVSLKLTATVLLVVPPLVISANLWGRVIRRLARQAQDQLAKASGQLSESLAAVDTVQSFTREDHEAGRYGGAIERAFDLFVKQIGARSWFMSVSSFLAFGAIAGIFWLGGHMVIDGKIAPDELGKFFMYTLAVAGAVGSLAGVVGSYNQALGSTARIFEILDSAPEIRDAPDAVDLVAPRGEIKFEGVSFSYDDRDTEVIRDLDLEHRAGPGLRAGRLERLGQDHDRPAWSCAFGTPRPVGSASTARTSARSGWPRCVEPWPRSRRTRSCSRARSARTSATAGSTPATPRSTPPRQAGNATASSTEFPDGYDTDRRRARGQAQRRPAPAPRDRAGDPPRPEGAASSTRRPRRSTARASTWSKPRSSACKRAARPWSSPTGSARSATPIGSSCSITARWSRAARHEELMAKGGAYARLVARQAALEPERAAS